MMKIEALANVQPNQYLTSDNKRIMKYKQEHYSVNSIITG